MAIRLSKAFGGSAESWLIQQAQFYLWQAKQHEHRIHVKKFAAWLKNKTGILNIFFYNSRFCCNSSGHASTLIRIDHVTGQSADSKGDRQIMLGAWLRQISTFRHNKQPNSGLIHSVMFGLVHPALSALVILLGQVYILCKYSAALHLHAPNGSALGVAIRLVHIVNYSSPARLLAPEALPNIYIPWFFKVFRTYPNIYPDS